MSEFYQNYKIGVLGGGQLGRMMIQAGIDFNLDIHVLDPDPDAPCKSLASTFTKGSFTDESSVYNFGKDKDLITIEIENVSVSGLKRLEQEGKKVFPQPQIIELIQDKVKQKIFYRTHNIPTAEFRIVKSKAELVQHSEIIPAVNKLAKSGYDGRGVKVIRTAEDLNAGFDDYGLLERFVNFKKEISVIVARNEKNQIKTYPPVELVFHSDANLVEYLFSPAEVSREVEILSKKIAIDLAEKLNLVGLLAVEMFVTEDDSILVNEIAPRTHNSGHQSIEGNQTSQFEQHLRAILNLPLGSTKVIQPSAMVNLLGEEGYSGLAMYEGLMDVLSVSGVHIHLYGKKITKPFRKMGHVTITDKDLNKLREKAAFVKSTLKVKA
jgi:5-(carboxyamino)imidazole ribonucleotide synthase